MAKKPRAPTPPPLWGDDLETPVPTEMETEDPTRPTHLIERSQSRYDSDLTYRDEMNAAKVRYDSDLAFRAMWNMMRRQRRESTKTMSAVGDTALAALDASAKSNLDGLVKWQHQVDTILSSAKWILGFVIAATLGSIVVVVSKIYVWGESNGSLEIRVENLEKTQAKFRPEESPSPRWMPQPQEKKP